MANIPNSDRYRNPVRQSRKSSNELASFKKAGAGQNPSSGLGRKALGQSAGSAAETARGKRPEPDDLLIPDDWTPSQRVLRPTGIEFLDAALDGGAAAGQVHAIVDADGSCAWALGNTILVEAAKQELQTRQRSGCERQKKLAIYLVPEGADLLDRRLYALAYAANVEVDLLYRMRESALFSNRARGERERAKSWIPLVKNGMAFAEDGGEATSRYLNPAHTIVPIVKRMLKAHAADSVSTIVLDRVACMMDEVDDDDSGAKHGQYMWRRIGELRSEVAARFGCDVWIVHTLVEGFDRVTCEGKPLRGRGTDFRVLRTATDFCFTIGVPQPDGAAVMGCVRHRRHGDHSPMAIQIQNKFCRVVPATTHRINLHSGRLRRAR